MFATEIVVRGNMAPPKGARPTPELHRGRTVYEEVVPIMERREVKDAAGKTLYHLNRAGEKIAPRMELVKAGEETRQYVIEDLGQGITQRNYDFRESESEARARGARQQATPEAILERLARLEAATGALNLTEEDLDALAAEGEVESEPAKGRKGGK